MTIKAKKLRLSVPFSPELYEAVEQKAKLLGVSMSAMVSFIVGNYLASEKTLIDGTLGLLESKLKELVKAEEDKK
jgi:hypothetical protein